MSIAPMHDYRIPGPGASHLSELAKILDASVGKREFVGLPFLLVKVGHDDTIKGGPGRVSPKISHVDMTTGVITSPITKKGGFWNVNLKNTYSCRNGMAIARGGEWTNSIKLSLLEDQFGWEDAALGLHGFLKYFEGDSDILNGMRRPYREVGDITTVLPFMFLQRMGVGLPVGDSEVLRAIDRAKKTLWRGLDDQSRGWREECATLLSYLGLSI